MVDKLRPVVTIKPSNPIRDGVPGAIEASQNMFGGVVSDYFQMNPPGVNIGKRYCSGELAFLTGDCFGYRVGGNRYRDVMASRYGDFTPAYRLRG